MFYKNEIELKEEKKQITVEYTIPPFDVNGKEVNIPEREVVHKPGPKEFVLPEVVYTPEPYVYTPEPTIIDIPEQVINTEPIVFQPPPIALPKDAKDGKDGKDNKPSKPTYAPTVYSIKKY